MKKLLIICTAIVCAFASCTKDVSKDIIGEWNLTQMHYIEKEDGKVVSEATEYPNESFNASIIFKEDGTCKLVETEDGEAYVVDATWVYAGDKLVLTSDEMEESIAWDVLTCSKKELVVSMTEKDTYEGVSYEETVELYFSRK